MVSIKPSEVLSTLTKREAILYAVDITGCDKREITQSVSVSRSTVDRSIRELENVGLVTRGTDGYRRTLLGELILSEYYRFKSQTTELLSAGEIFTELPPETKLGRTLLDDATIVTASQATPNEPISELCELLAEATECRMYAPVVLPSLIKSHDRVLSGVDSLDLFITDPVLSQIVSNHDDTIQKVQDSINFKLVEQELNSFVVSITNSRYSQAAVLVLDGTRRQALIKNCGDEAVAWVDSQLDSIAKTGTPVAMDSKSNHPN